MQASTSEKDSARHESGHGGHKTAFNGLSDFCRYDDQQSHPNYNKPLQMLGMAKKAGLLAIGGDATQTAIKSCKAELVIFASDTSEASVRRVSFDAENFEVMCVCTPYTKFELGRIAGRGSPGTLAIVDLGLAEEFLKRLSEIDKNRYDTAVKNLSTKTLNAKALNARASKPSKSNNSKNEIKSVKASGKPTKGNKRSKLITNVKVSKVENPSKANNRRTKV